MREISRSPDALLVVDGLTVRFGGIVALDRVSFDVASGLICGIIGPNGSGKTTLFNCLSRLYQAESGRVTFDGHDLLKVPKYRVAPIGIGRTFQNLALFRSLTVRQNVLIGGHSRGRSSFISDALRLRGAVHAGKQLNVRTAELLDMLDLTSLSERTVSSLPFGTQKRVELARALATAPKLLLLDEPAAGLNHEEVDNLATLIVSLRDGLGTTILLVEHHMNLVMRVSDKVVTLNFGRAIAQGSPAAVRNDQEVVRAYLGSAT